MLTVPEFLEGLVKAMPVEEGRYLRYCKNCGFYQLKEERSEEPCKGCGTHEEPITLKIEVLPRETAPKRLSVVGQDNLLEEGPGQ